MRIIAPAERIQQIGSSWGHDWEGRGEGGGGTPRVKTERDMVRGLGNFYRKLLGRPVTNALNN